MAFVHVRVAGPTLAPEQVRRLQDDLTHIVTETLGEDRESLSVLVEPAQARNWSVGGERPTTLAHVVITVSAGRSPTQKTACVSHAYGLLRRMLGSELTPFSYVLVKDVPPHAWGYGGVAQADRTCGTAMAVS